MLRTIPVGGCPVTATTSLGCFSTCRPVAARSRAVAGRSRAVVRLTGAHRKATRCVSSEASVSCCVGRGDKDHWTSLGRGKRRSAAAVSLPVFGSGAPATSGGARLPRILCYGDSNTVGFCEQGRRYQPYGQALSEALASARTPCEVTACGLCGLTAKEMDEEIHSAFIEPVTGPSGRGLARLLEDDGPFDLVVIMAGTNDLGALLSSDATQVHVANLHALCHEHGIPTVNLAPPSAVSHERLCKERRRLADLMGAWASSKPDVLHIDAEDLCPRSATTLWEPDEIHFSAHGSNELGRLLASKIAAIVGQALPLPPTSQDALPAANRGLSPSGIRPTSPVRSRSPQVRQIIRPVTQENGRGNDNVIPVDAEKVVERSAVPLKLIAEKRVSEHIVSTRALRHDVPVQDKLKLVERAVITLQKMQRKRVLHQCVELSEGGPLQAQGMVTERAATTLEKMQRKRVLGRSATVTTVRKLQCGDKAPGCLQTAPVLTVAVQGKVNPLGCVV